MCKYVQISLMGLSINTAHQKIIFILTLWDIKAANYSWSSNYFHKYITVYYSCSCIHGFLAIGFPYQYC